MQKYLFIFLLLIPNIVFANPIKLTEISFDDPDGDWIEIQSLAAEKIDLKDYFLQIDDTNISFPSITLDPLEYLVVTFKNRDFENIKVLTTDHKGLTATTDQITIFSPENEIIDSVCWSNISENSTEQKDLDEIFQLNGWNSNSLDECMNSSSVNKNTTLFRVDPFEDTNSLNDWSYNILPSPGEDLNQFNFTPPNIRINEIMINPEGPDTDQEWIEFKNLENKKVSLKHLFIDDEEGGASPKNLNLELEPLEIKAINNIGFSLNNNEDSIRILLPDMTPFIEVLYEESEEGKSLSYLDEKYIWTDPSPDADNIIPQKPQPSENSPEINEILPNPSGKDNDKEWIELKNPTNQEINLKDWKIQTNIKTQKYEVLPEMILPPQSEASIPIKSLPNTENTIKLLDPSEQVHQTVSYQKAPEDKSFSKSTTIDLETNNTEENWDWSEPTPNQQNNNYLKIYGIITEVKSDHFLLESELEEYSIYFNKKLPEIQEENKVSTIIKPFQTNSFELIQINLIENNNKNPSESDTTNLILISIIILLIAIQNPKIKKVLTQYTKKLFQQFKFTNSIKEKT